MPNENRKNPNRRDFLKLAGLGGAAGLGALGLPGLNPISLARAAEQRVVIGTWGGDYNRILQEVVGSAIRKQAGIDLVSLVGSSDSRRTKLLVDARMGRSSMDLACLSDLDMHLMAQQDALTTLSEDAAPNLKNVYPRFRRPYAAPHIYSALVIVYNKNRVKKAPTSVKDLWRSEFSGKVGLSDILYKYFIPMVADAFGGSPTNYKPGMDALMELKKSGVPVYPSNEAIANAFNSGEITATLMWRARAFQWQKAGLPVASTVPSGGALPVIFEAGMSRYTKSPEAAATALNQMLDPKAQVEFAKGMGYVPTVSNADLPEDMRQTIGFTDAERENFVETNYDYAIGHLSDMLTWWNREFKG